MVYFMKVKNRGVNQLLIEKHYLDNYKNGKAFCQFAKF